MVHQQMVELVSVAQVLFMFKCVLSADCDVNNLRSWSDPHAQLNINDVTHGTVFTEANVAAAAEASLYGLLLKTVCGGSRQI